MELGESTSPGQPTPPPQTHASLTIQAVYFFRNHVVERDTHGDFATPEWLRGRRRQWPVCYTRNVKIKLEAKFNVVISPDSTETVAVRGTAQVGSLTLEWSGNVSVSPTAPSAQTTVLECSVALPDEVACIDRMSISWEAQPPGSAWNNAGISNHCVYVTLSTPNGTPHYWTLLHISCRAAHGARTARELVEHAFTPFTTLNLTRRRDRHNLTYWNPESTAVSSTRDLLANPDGSGRCGAWAELLIDMYKVHGVLDGKKIMPVRTKTDLRMRGEGFLVKNWRFIGSGSHSRPFTHTLGSECVSQHGIPGQRNPNPPPAFYNHFIVQCFNKFYDPSYGGVPTASQSEWENGAIDGLFSNSLFRAQRAGYPKSRHATTNLLEFWDIATNSRI